MKAIGFDRPLPISDSAALLDLELPTPELLPHDVLVEVRAIAVNPADVKGGRQRRAGFPRGRRSLLRRRD